MTHPRKTHEENEAKSANLELDRETIIRLTIEKNQKNAAIKRIEREIKTHRADIEVMSNDHESSRQQVGILSVRLEMMEKYNVPKGTLKDALAQARKQLVRLEAELTEAKHKARDILIALGQAESDVNSLHTHQLLDQWHKATLAARKAHAAEPHPGRDAAEKLGKQRGGKK